MGSYLSAIYRWVMSRAQTVRKAMNAPFFGYVHDGDLRYSWVCVARYTTEPFAFTPARRARSASILN